MEGYKPMPANVKWHEVRCPYPGCKKYAEIKGMCGTHYGAKFSADRREKFKKKAVELLGGKCIKCGLVHHIYAIYDFHHRDPTTKAAGFSIATIKSWDIYWEEVQKCDLLCVICHRVITWQDRKEIGYLVSSRQNSSDKFAHASTTKEIKSKHWNNFTCLRCKRNFMSVKDNPIRCTLCQSIHWKCAEVNKGGASPKWTMENLLPYLSGNPTVDEISKILGVTDNDVRYIIKKLDLWHLVKRRRALRPPRCLI